MSTQSLIDAVRRQDVAEAQTLLEPAAVNDHDEHGWTPLHWAAGTGNTHLVEMLIAAGANLTAAANDDRTPLDVALAAEHWDVIDLFRNAYDSAGIVLDNIQRDYARAYPLGDLRRFDRWHERWPAEDASQQVRPEEDDGDANGDGRDMEDVGPRSDERIVFLHDDYTVSLGMWKGEDVIFDAVTEEWKAFCATSLQFRPLTIFDRWPEVTVDE
jgi:hypothetical protein